MPWRWASTRSSTPETAFAAEVCGVADRTGTLEPGKDADFCAVAGDPLADINALHQVVGVLARGDRAPTQEGGGG
jgi:imidazolonepropionase-like amidohydrolase